MSFVYKFSTFDAVVPCGCIPWVRLPMQLSSLLMTYISYNYGIYDVGLLAHTGSASAIPPVARKSQKLCLTLLSIAD